MRWAFWRAREQEPGSQRPTAVARPLPDGVGLPTRAPTARPAGRRDEDDTEGTPTAPASPFSGASPDAGRTPPERPVPPAPAGPPPVLDETQLARSGPVVAQLVRAVLADQPEAVRAALTSLGDPTGTREAAVAASGALAARLPALSGLDGAVTFDEHDGDLLHAYADLLAERAERRRAAVTPAVTREQLMVVAHLAAAAAVGDAASEPSLLVLAGMPAEEQLQAACVLLAQTATDGGRAVGLAGEIAELFG